MPNEENLIPNSERTPEERREIAQKGGASAACGKPRTSIFRCLLQTSDRSINFCAAMCLPRISTTRWQ